MQRVMQFYRFLLICIFCLAAVGGVNASDYNYPISDPYKATILGTPPPFMPPLPEADDRKTRDIYPPHQHEDYRWAVLRAKPEFQGKWKWTLFNLFFICGYQQTLILLFTLPIIIALQFNDTPLSLFDWTITLAMIFFVVFEAIADQQHWSYQSKKWKRIMNKEILEGDFKKGFLDKGLWAYFRHPNYFAEQAVWLCFFLFCVSCVLVIHNFCFSVNFPPNSLVVIVKFFCFKNWPIFFFKKINNFIFIFRLV